MPDKTKSNLDLKNEIDALRSVLAHFGGPSTPADRPMVQAKPAAPAAGDDRDYREIFEHSPMGLYRSSPEGRVLMANPAFLRMTGYDTLEDLRQIDVGAQACPPEHPRRLFIEAVEKTGRLDGFRTVWVRRDGSTIHLRESSRAIRDAAGKTLYYEGTVEDISAQQVAEERLARQFELEKLVTALAVSVSNVGSVDLDAEIEKSIASLGTHLDVDRISVFVLSGAGPVISKTHEWAAKGVDGGSATREELDVSRFPGLVHRAMRGEDVAITTSAEEGKLQAERDYLASKGIKSSLVVPLMSGNTAMGSLVLSHIRAEKVWPEDVRDMVRILAEVIGHALEARTRAVAFDKERRLMSTLMDAIPVKIYFKDRDCRFLRINRVMAEAFHLTNAGEAEGRTDHDYFSPEHARQAQLDEQEVMRTGRPMEKEEKETWPDGSETWVHSIKAPFFDEKGAVAGTVGISRDITAQKHSEEDRRKIEAQMQHTQKLESLGVLASGIAHDFNNLLMGILGNVSLAMMDITPQSSIWTHVKRIETAATSAAELTNQMLTYSGRSKAVSQAVDLNALVHEMSQLLDVSVSRKASLECEFTKEAPVVEGDTAQLRQVVMNLITNAGDAVDQHAGLIRIRTGIMQCDRLYLAGCTLGGELNDGPYAWISVSDNGCGMDARTLARIFDPFFTTKVKGRGLGLAAVLGIVKGHKGALRVYSEVGKGTEFRILFPASARKAMQNDTAKKEKVDFKGSGKVLVVDDDDIVRNVTERILAKIGFSVLAAGDGTEAVEVLKSVPAGDIRLVLLDVTLPDAPCVKVIEDLRAVQPAIPIILMSGYNEQSATADMTSGAYQAFIQKPFSADMLRGCLKEILK